jgi:hypothetical protein
MSFYIHTRLRFGHNSNRLLDGGYGKPPYIVMYRQHLVGRDSIPAVWAAKRVMTESQYPPFDSVSKAC